MFWEVFFFSIFSLNNSTPGVSWQRREEEEEEEEEEEGTSPEEDWHSIYTEDWLV